MCLHLGTEFLVNGNASDIVFIVDRPHSVYPCPKPMNLNTNSQVYDRDNGIVSQDPDSFNDQSLARRLGLDIHDIADLETMKNVM